MNELNCPKSGAPKGTIHLLFTDITIPENARSSDETISNNFEKEAYNNYFIKSLDNYGFKTKLHSLGFGNYKQIIREEIGDPNSCDGQILHLCDGSELDGFLGTSVPEFLVQEGYSFAGSTATFSRICTDKHIMKDLFQNYGVPTSPYINITEWDDKIEQKIIDKKMKYPLFVKVATSYGSIGLSRESIVMNFDKVKTQAKKILAQYGKIILEEFILGAEYSVLVYEDQGEIKAYRPIEKIFNFNDPYDKWLTFKAVWEDYKWAFTFIMIEDRELEQKLMEISIKAFKSCNGNAFARVDIRRRDETGELLVLEINDTCGLGPGTTTEFILNQCGETTEMFIEMMVKNAKRYSIPKKDVSLKCEDGRDNQISH